MKRVPLLILIFVGFAFALDCSADSSYHIDNRTLLLDGVTPNPNFNHTIATGLCACLGFESTLSGMPEDSTITLIVKIIDHEPIRGVQVNIYHDAGSSLVFGDVGAAYKGKKLEMVYDDNGQAMTASDAMQILSNEVDDHVTVIVYSTNRAQTAGDGEEGVLFTITYKALNGHQGLPSTITFYLDEVKLPGTSSAPDLLNVSCEYPGIDNAVTFNTSEMGIDSETIPTVFSLSQNYPNPFNPTTRIAFDLPEKSSINMVIYNVLGQQVNLLESNILKAGHHILEWNGLDTHGNEVASGIYFYELRTKNFVARKKMLLLR
ncbi:MAG: T9SS type A sorting domain-containing protein [Fidelibacterota bacterium]